MNTTTMQQSKTRDIVFIGIFAALIAICSWISIPTTVPFTLQTMGVFTAVGLLGRQARQSCSSCLHPAGSGRSACICRLFQRCRRSVRHNRRLYYRLSGIRSADVGLETLCGRGKIVLAVSMVLGLAVCYAIGTLWFMAVYAKTSGAVGLGTVLGWCVIPFIIPDLIKIAVALFLTDRFRKVIA